MVAVEKKNEVEDKEVTEHLLLQPSYLKKEDEKMIKKYHMSNEPFTASLDNITDNNKPVNNNSMPGEKLYSDYNIPDVSGTQTHTFGTFALQGIG